MNDIPLLLPCYSPKLFRLRGRPRSTGSRYLGRSFRKLFDCETFQPRARIICSQRTGRYNGANWKLFIPIKSINRAYWWFKCSDGFARIWRVANKFHCPKGTGLQRFHLDLSSAINYRQQKTFEEHRNCHPFSTVSERVSSHREDARDPAKESARRSRPPRSTRLETIAMQPRSNSPTSFSRLITRDSITNSPG